MSMFDRASDIAYDLEKAEVMLAKMKADRDRGREHVQHLLSGDHGLFIGPYVGGDDSVTGCPSCRAAREWSEQ